MKYKVGQRVKVKPLSKIKNRKSGPGFVDEMIRFTGTIIKIAGSHTKTHGERIYTAEGWNWKPEWFDPIEDDFLTDKDFEI